MSSGDSGADGWRSHYASGGTYNFTYDPQGSLTQRQFVGSVGSRASDTSAFDAYGSLVGSLNANANPTTHRDTTGFGGQWGYYTDTETGLLCLTHRYYDPGTSKFVNEERKRTKRRGR